MFPIIVNSNLLSPFFDGMGVGCGLVTITYKGRIRPKWVPFSVHSSFTEWGFSYVEDVWKGIETCCLGTSGPQIKYILVTDALYGCTI